MDDTPIENGMNDSLSNQASISNKNSNYHSVAGELNDSSSYKKDNRKFNKQFFRGRGRGRFVTSQSRNVAKHCAKMSKNDAPYGNYPFYYGYRNQCSSDNRIAFLKKEWIVNQCVLDIGCNVGHLTLELARDFCPHMIIGLDIDPFLIRTARKNTKHYLTDNIEYNSEFPMSCVSQYGPLATAAMKDRKKWMDCDNVAFPYNICFVQGNYVLHSDDMLQIEDEKFDTILCLSVTKWIQLNWGDEGLKRVFLRIYAQLKNGGHLILEPQPLKSYYKSKKISEIHRKHYSEMKLFPENYNKYLLEVVGFKTCELINNVQDNLTEVKGFERPLYLFTKVTDNSNTVPKHIIFQTDDDDNDSDNSSVENAMEDEELSD